MKGKPTVQLALQKIRQRSGLRSKSNPRAIVQIKSPVPNFTPTNLQTLTSNKSGAIGKAVIQTTQLHGRNASVQPQTTFKIRTNSRGKGISPELTMFHTSNKRLEDPSQDS
jgi:hypothetical protein